MATLRMNAKMRTKRVVVLVELLRQHKEHEAEVRREMLQLNPALALLRKKNLSRRTSREKRKANKGTELMHNLMVAQDKLNRKQKVEVAIKFDAIDFTELHEIAFFALYIFPLDFERNTAIFC